MPGIFTSVTTQAAPARPGHDSTPSAEGNGSTAKPRSRSICAMECRAVSSSSTTATSGRPLCPLIVRPPRPACRRSASGLPAGWPDASSAAAGRRTVNVAPRPGRLSAPIVPPWSATIEREIERPRPWPLSLVVKNGWKSRRATSSVNPTPVSATSTTTGSSAPGSLRDRTESRRTGLASTAWRALVSRLRNTCDRRVRSPRTGGTSSASEEATSTCESRIWGIRKSTVSRTTLFTSSAAMARSPRRVSSRMRLPMRAARSTCSEMRRRLAFTSSSPPTRFSSM